MGKALSPLLATAVRHADGFLFEKGTLMLKSSVVFPAV